MIPKHTVAASDHSEPELFVPLWFRISTVLLVLVSILLLAVVLGERVYTSNLAAAALICILVALSGAAALHVRAWYVGRKEFSSVYQHVLDGILLLDDRGVCVDANPAALGLLGASSEILLTHSFGQFYVDPQQFLRQWQDFWARGMQRGQTQLLRVDGSIVAVRYKISANHLPGRHMMILCDITERLEAQDASLASQERLQRVTDNIHEIVWMMDASSKKVIQINRAYETITGRSIESLEKDPFSYMDLIHPSDREHFLAKLEDAVRSGHFDEEFRIVRPDGGVRWLWAKASPLPRFGSVVQQLVGTAQDITAKKIAAAQVAEHLAIAETARAQADLARAEAEALRKATLAITQNLRMDTVLDTLLRCVFEIIPYDSASVIFAEDGGRLFVAREAPALAPAQQLMSLELKDHAFLQRLVFAKKSVHLVDTHDENEWREHKAFSNVRSWLAVPLVASDAVLGLLSIGSTKSGFFTTEHFRMAKSLAIPAAVAIQNARLYEWAAIYTAERKTLLKKINDSPKIAEFEEEIPPQGFIT